MVRARSNTGDATPLEAEPHLPRKVIQRQVVDFPFRRKDRA